MRVCVYPGNVQIVRVGVFFTSIVHLIIARVVQYCSSCIDHDTRHAVEVSMLGQGVVSNTVW